MFIFIITKYGVLLKLRVSDMIFVIIFKAAAVNQKKTVKIAISS